MQKPTETGNKTAPVVYTAAEAAAILGIKTATINGYIHAGKLDAFRVGTRWRITADALDRYIEGHSTRVHQPGTIAPRSPRAQAAHRRRSAA